MNTYDIFTNCNMIKIIAPSVLSADLSDLKSSSELINQSNADWLHVDVMDGVFVQNFSFGFPIIEVLKKHCTKLLDVHLMIVEPEKHIERFVEAGSDILTVHFEALKNPLETLDIIRKCGVKVGIAINPNIPISSLSGLVGKVDMVLLMSVFAGYGGQKFLEDTWKRLRELKELTQKENPNCLIEVDGGVNLENSYKLFEKGANVLVAGTSIYGSPDPNKTINKMLNKQLS